MKILIAVPCMDQVAAEFAQSLACLNKIGECHVVFQLSSLIYDSRNNLIRTALKLKADYILWLDSDMVFGPDILEKLLLDMEAGRDIVSGLYFRRRPPYTPVISKKLRLTEEGGIEEEYPDYPDEIFEIEGCGFGCVLMRTEVAVNIILQNNSWFSPVDGFGEDLSFCLRAREAGHRIWCDPKVKLGHVGHAVITEEFYREVGGKNGNA